MAFWRPFLRFLDCIRAFRSRPGPFNGGLLGLPLLACSEIKQDSVFYVQGMSHLSKPQVLFFSKEEDFQTQGTTKPHSPLNAIRGQK